MIKARINSTGEVVEVRPYQTEKYDFMVCRNGGIMGELYMRSELTIIGDKELKFVESVKKMRKAQKRQEYTDSTLDREAIIECRKLTKQRESEVDEYLKKMEMMAEDPGEISDGYHTFNELYEYRLLYNAGMFNELAKQNLYDVHKSKRHSDGTIPFDNPDNFIVVAELPTGQISNHYQMKDWGLFDIPEKDKANEYDGHSPKDVAERLRKFLTLKKELL